MKKYLKYISLLSGLLFIGCDDTLDLDVPRENNIRVEVIRVNNSGEVPIERIITTAPDGSPIESDVKLVNIPGTPVNGIVKFIDETEDVKSRLWSFPESVQVVKPESVAFEPIQINGEDLRVPYTTQTVTELPEFPERLIYSNSSNIFELVDEANPNTSTEREVYLRFTESLGDITSPILGDLEVVLNSGRLITRELAVSVKQDTKPELVFSIDGIQEVQKSTGTPDFSTNYNEEEISVTLFDDTTTGVSSDEKFQGNDFILWDITCLSNPSLNPVKFSIVSGEEEIGLVSPFRSTISEASSIKLKFNEISTYKVNYSYLRGPINEPLIGFETSKVNTKSIIINIKDPNAVSPTLNYSLNTLEIDYGAVVDDINTVASTFTVTTEGGENITITDVDISADNQKITLTLDDIYGNILLNGPAVGSTSTTGGVTKTLELFAEKSVIKGDNLLEDYGNIEGSWGATVDAEGSGNSAGDIQAGNFIGPLNGEKGNPKRTYAVNFNTQVGIFGTASVLQTLLFKVSPDQGVNGSQALEFDFNVEDDNPGGRSIILFNGGDRIASINPADLQLPTESDQADVYQRYEISFKVKLSDASVVGPRFMNVYLADINEADRKPSKVYDDTGNGEKINAIEGSGQNGFNPYQDHRFRPGGNNGVFGTGEYVTLYGTILVKASDKFVNPSIGLKFFRTQRDASQLGSVFFDDFEMRRIIPNQNK